MRNGPGGVGAILFPGLWFHTATAFWAASEMNLALRRRSRDEGGASQVAWVIENPPANAGEVRDAGSIPGSGRSPGGGRGNPLYYSCLENPRDGGAWWAAVSGVAQRTRLMQLSSSSSSSSKSLRDKNDVLPSSPCVHAKLFQSCWMLCDPIDQ